MCVCVCARAGFLLPSSLALSVLCHFVLLTVHALDVSPNNILLLLCDKCQAFLGCCMALVKQLGDDSCKMVCVACCHIPLVFAPGR